MNKLVLTKIRRHEQERAKLLGVSISSFFLLQVGQLVSIPPSSPPLTVDAWIKALWWSSVTVVIPHGMIFVSWWSLTMQGHDLSRFI